MNIPDAAVEAAAIAIFGLRGRKWTVMEELTCTSQAKRALEAAAPHLQSAAWDEGYSDGVREEQPGWTKNPYRKATK